MPGGSVLIPLLSKQKWQIYRECQQQDAKVGEILRRNGLYSSDLIRIRKTVEKGALEALTNSIPGRKRLKTVPIDEYNRLQTDLKKKEEALAEQSDSQSSIQPDCFLNNDLGRCVFIR